MPRDFSLLIKPASADCNLRCDYCFYLEKQALYPEHSRHRMSDEVLEKLIRSYLSTDQSVYSFGWQGGEPTLMGYEFFSKVVELQQKYGRRGAVIGNGLQTNGTLIDSNLARLLAQYKFLLGCSVDGPANLHDRFRRSIDHKPTHHRVLEGIALLRQHGVEFNSLVLVSKANVNHADQVYHYLVNSYQFYHQYIPCVEFDEQGQMQPYAITGKEWGRFLCRIFDLWFEQHIRKVSIRLFDAILMRLVEGTNSICTLSGNCSQYFLVEYNGDVYPCDFFVEPRNKLGNIMDTSWSVLLQSTQYRKFGNLKSSWNNQCDRCEFCFLCQGDCLKNRYHPQMDSKNLSHLCEGWKKFYQHSLEKFEQLAKEIKTQRLQDEKVSSTKIHSNQRPQTRIGRNQPCPCGSGLKFKKCCGG